MKKEIVLNVAQQCEYTQVTMHFKMVNFIFVYYHSGKKNLFNYKSHACG